MNLWKLPTTADLGGKRFGIRYTWRDALAVMAILEEEGPVWQRWFRAIDRFFVERVPDELLAEAAKFLEHFLTAGQVCQPGPKRMDWQQDAMEIISDINRVAGREVRETDVHWWTFLSWFHAIGEGQLSSLVALLCKLARGEKLTEAERAFYAADPQKVRLQTSSDPQKQKLLERLGECRNAECRMQGM